MANGQIMWGRFLVASSLLMGAAYTLMATTTPTEEEFYNRLSPDLKAKVDAVRAQRAGMSQPVKEAIQSAGDDERVVWADDLKKAK
ncbi:uncharacterized protein EHS24_006049 [Apiotrichum porosum]|uniref:Cytochrome b mRNA-processing protein 4 n=1 Tax=Apiotrichum porosum TaxID=105984 RepID=A0A427Y0B3_9TREE|nr:uncharacterized protein EHS24_006049 [Apiotrichum porosum]RSH84527.1 hypothetical protein EHS24_006049 [Apiotrichum porosum]